MTRKEAQIFIDKQAQMALHYKDNINVITVRGANILADMLCEEENDRTCENCKLLNRDTGKSYSTCTELPLNMGADTITEFGCNWFEAKEKQCMSQ